MKRQELWPTLAEESLHGLPGDVVRAVDPHTEADPVAVLASLLAAFGGACGRGAHVRVGPDAHYLNVFAALVGETSKGRKGTSWACVRSLMSAADSAWADERIANGLSSGEGLIHAVRDATVRRDKKGEETVEGEGVADKRLLVLEPELAATLKVASRQGNIVSAVIRQAFDGEKLQTLTRNDPMKATGAHVSLVGHPGEPVILTKGLRPISPFCISIHRANSCRGPAYAGGQIAALAARLGGGYAGWWMRTSGNEPSRHSGE